jgi:hypothetical protein
MVAAMSLALGLNFISSKLTASVTATYHCPVSLAHQACFAPGSDVLPATFALDKCSGGAGQRGRCRPIGQQADAGRRKRRGVIGDQEMGAGDEAEPFAADRS